MHYSVWNTKRYDNQHAEIYTTESSDRAFEEEVMLSGFANADVKAEGLAYHTMMHKRLILLDTLWKQLHWLSLSQKKQ